MGGRWRELMAYEGSKRYSRARMLLVSSAIWKEKTLMCREAFLDGGPQTDRQSPVQH